MDQSTDPNDAIVRRRVLWVIWIGLGWLLWPYLLLVPMRAGWLTVEYYRYRWLNLAFDSIPQVAFTIGIAMAVRAARPVGGRLLLVAASAVLCFSLISKLISVTPRDFDSPWFSFVSLLQPMLSTSAWVIACWCVMRLTSARQPPRSAVRKAKLAFGGSVVFSLASSALHVWFNILFTRALARPSSMSIFTPEEEATVNLIQWMMLATDGPLLVSLLLFLPAALWRGHARGFAVAG